MCTVKKGNFCLNISGTVKRQKKKKTDSDSRGMTLLMVEKIHKPKFCLSTGKKT